jgi:xanthine dehydrogenase YagS FAD-binding subunit
MKKFKYINAATIEEAVSGLSDYDDKASVIAGGTDILDCLRKKILPEYPEALVNIKTIPELDYIKEEGGMLKIGALAKLSDIVKNATIKSKYGALAEAAYRVGSPELRNMGTIGGNICQFNRCWYYRASDSLFSCIRKGGGICYAMAGDNRYHSIFGAVNGCIAVNPSDIAPALIALGAKIKTSKRTIESEEFFDFAVPGETVLGNDEIVTEIQIPEFSGKSAFLKFAISKSTDFPIVNCAAAIANGTARICLNAVYNKPYRATSAEAEIAGKSINEANAEAASEAAMSGVSALPANKYKVQIAKTLVKRVLLACA